MTRQPRRRGSVGEHHVRRRHRGRPSASAAGLLCSAQVSASADPNTGFLTITAQDHDPRQAAAIANAFAAALADRQASQATTEIDQQVRALQQDSWPPTPRSNPSARVTHQTADRPAAGGDRFDQLGRFRHPGGHARPPRPVAPKTRRAVELALVIALLLGTGAVLVAENADRRLRIAGGHRESHRAGRCSRRSRLSAFSPDNLADPAQRGGVRDAPQCAHVFQRRAPAGQRRDREPAGQRRERRPVATGLALATARAGKTAILVDADLRRSQVSARLGITADAGLGAVLAGESPLEDVLVGASGRCGGRAESCSCVPAGPAPPNPAALLGSQADARAGAQTREAGRSRDRRQRRGARGQRRAAAPPGGFGKRRGGADGSHLQSGASAGCRR